MPVALHELHQRRLKATVNLVECGLDRMDQLLAEGGRTGIVQTVEDTLSADDREFLLERIARLRSLLHAFAQQFSLPQQPMDIRQVLNAELSSAWVMLENCRPKRMKGYGVEFDPAARVALEDSVQELIEWVIALRARIR